MSEVSVGTKAKIAVATWSALEDRVPVYALAPSTDRVVVRSDDRVSVLYGRCLHRGALMADGRVDGDHLICGVHGWGCLGMRACHTNNGPVGIATQKPALRKRLAIDKSAARLTRFSTATTELMMILARACGHAQLRDFELADLTTYDRDLAHLTGIPYAGVGQP